MKSTISTAAIAFAVISTLSLIALWLFAVPGGVSSSTFAFIAVIVLGGAAVALMTWRNAQATDTVAHVLHTTEAAPASTGPATRAR